MLDLTQPIYWQKILNHQITQHFGQYVWLIQQQQQKFVVKFVNDQANDVVKDHFRHELLCYQKFETYEFCPEFTIMSQQKSKLIKMPTQIATDLLILPKLKNWQEIHIENLNITEKINLFSKICIQVKKLHDLGYIHADLKPNNFAFNSLMEIKLLDFAQTQLHQTEMANHFTATPAYMAPELFIQQQVTIRSDLYALGVFLYELLMQHKPFQAKTYREWAIQHCQYDIPNISNNLYKYQIIIDKLLAKYPKNRFYNISELLNQLDIVRKLDN